MSKLDKLTTLIPFEEIEQTAQQQIYNNLELDFLIRMAIMPDCHAGYDLPIGAVALLDGMISPSYVGYDIGCGMCFVDTKVPVNDLLKTREMREHVFKKIKDTVPVGTGIEHDYPQACYDFKSAAGDKVMHDKIQRKINRQIGTLGSGNHFIEVGVSRNKTICVTIHSGSRGAGWVCADWYMKKSRFFETTSELGQAYLVDLNFFLAYALENRKQMMGAVLKRMTFQEFEINKLLKTMVNENHNHAVVTEEGILHRKGATPADTDQLGVIPGNMFDGVWLTRGLGNQEYLSSASHGAGRTMSRNAAKKKLSFEKFQKQMQNVVCDVTKEVLDEAPGAYKNIETVIKRQEKIVVDVIDVIKPIIVVKG